MKMRKLMVALAATLLIGVAPAIAMAAPTVSPSTVTASGTTTASNGTSVVVNVSGKIGNEGTESWIRMDPTDDQASNTPEGASVVASFVVTQQNTTAPYTFSYELGSEYAGAAVTVYIQHDDGTTEVVERTADGNGTISFEQDRLCIHTVVAEPTGGASATTDTGATAPYTGVPTTLVAGMTAASCVCAAGVAVALRKKVSE